MCAREGHLVEALTSRAPGARIGRARLCLIRSASSHGHLGPSAGYGPGSMSRCYSDVLAGTLHGRKEMKSMIDAEQAVKLMADHTHGS